MDHSDPRVYNLLGELSYRYPDIKQWYRDKILPRSQSSVRITLGCYGGVACGISIADLAKNKLCTLYVKERFRAKGLGSQLLDSALVFLNSSQPYFTCSEAVSPEYATIAARYKWTCKPSPLAEASFGPGGRELYYNCSHRRVTLTN